MTESLNYEPSHSAVYYTPPRQLDLRRTIVGTVGASVAVIVGAIAYGLILPQISSFIVRIGAVVCAALATGLISRAAVRHGKIFSQVIGALVATFLGLLTLYIMWLAWIFEYFHRSRVAFSVWHLAIHPIWFLRIVQFLCQMGTWSYKHEAVKGFPLLVMWVIEAGSVLASAVIFGVKSVGSSNLFCPACSAELKQACRPPRFAVDQQSEIIAAVENRNFASLDSYPRRRHEDDPELGLRLQSCPRCAGTHVLTLSRVAWERDANGHLKVGTRPLVNQLLVTADEAEEIKRLSPDFKPAGEAGPETLETKAQSDMHVPTESAQGSESLGISGSEIS